MLASSYRVCTATLVEPRVTLLPSLNRTKIRFRAGSNGTWLVLVPLTKIPKVGVALAAMVVGTLGAGGARHTLVTGFV